MAPYKGPIIPALATGGFLREGEFEYDSTDYSKATGLILTFLVRNSLKEEDLVPVIKWEQRYARVKRKGKLKPNNALKLIINTLWMCVQSVKQ